MYYTYMTTECIRQLIRTANAAHHTNRGGMFARLQRLKVLDRCSKLNERHHVERMNLIVEVYGSDRIDAAYARAYAAAYARAYAIAFDDITGQALDVFLDE